jgi:hypothetical protein
MKPLKQENFEDLKKKVYDLLNKTKVEIGHNTDGKTLAALSNIFAKDLMIEKRFGEMTFNQVEDAFRLGVRFAKDEPFLNVRTFYKWIWTHKKERIDAATYQVETLKENPKEVLYYQEPLKLLK